MVQKGVAPQHQPPTVALPRTAGTSWTARRLPQPNDQFDDRRLDYNQGICGLDSAGSSSN